MNRQAGQGLLEYLLIMGVIVFAVIGVALSFRSGVNTAQDTFVSGGISAAVAAATN